MLAIAFLLLVLDDPKPDSEVRPVSIGKLTHPAIKEASGIVKSRRSPGIYWVLNDSQNPNTIFAVKADGSLVREYTVNAVNIDWEDIATDDSGHLYIADIGNNGHRLPLRVIHRIDEPDPTVEPTSQAPLKVLKSWHYQFPAEGRFDAEGLFLRGDTLYLTDKNLEGGEAVVYSLAADKGASLLNPATPKRVATLSGFVQPVTGADLTTDGKLLAVCSTEGIGVYQAEGDSWKKLAVRTFHLEDQIEAICWDGLDLIIAGEDRGVFRIAEKDWRIDGK